MAVHTVRSKRQRLGNIGRAVDNNGRETYLILAAGKVCAGSPGQLLYAASRPCEGVK
jgi:hypothetical protein